MDDLERRREHEDREDEPTELSEAAKGVFGDPGEEMSFYDHAVKPPEDSVCGADPIVAGADVEWNLDELVPYCPICGRRLIVRR